MVKISIIIPVYNAEKYLRECLDSALAQTLKGIEIICIDDGSIDYSLEILLEYGRKYENIVVLQQKNQGSGLARNKGMEWARGKYLCFMDADDYYAQDYALERLFIEAEKRNCAICGGNIMAVYEGEKKKWSDWFYENEKILFKDYGSLGCYQRYIFRTDIIRKNNIEFPNYRRYQDPPFLLKAMISVQEFYTVNEVVYTYRIGHKKVSFTFDVALDFVKAVRECFKMSQDNNLVKVYEMDLKYTLFRYIPVIYKFSDQDQIWEIISDINKICVGWLGKTLDFFYDKASMEKYVLDLQNKRRNLITKCREAQEVVIYGAGVVGKFFLENFGKECNHIAGFAVSKNNVEEAFKQGDMVREITEYSRNALVVVAAGPKYAEEILQNLERLQFRNVCYVEYAGLKMMTEL